MKNKRLSVRSKIWITDDSGDVVFGLGRMKILNAVRKSGSIQSAAKELSMSYRAVWARIKVTEERLGERLLIRSIGGKSGGGSKLTPFAIQLMARFQKLHDEVVQASDELFEEILVDEDD